MLRRAWKSTDAAGIGLYLALALVGGFVAQRRMVPPMRELDTAGVALICATCLVLAWAHRHPELVFGVTTLLMVGYLAAFYPYGPVIVSVAIAMYHLATRASSARAVAACATSFAALMAASVLAEPQLTAADVGSFVTAWALCLVLPLFVGKNVRLRREAAAARAEESAAQERLGLAREVHDVVAHGLAVISMQSGAALHVFDRQPDTARAALTAIRETSGAALAELRRTLDGVRDSAGLAGLPELVERFSHGGLSVDLRTSGEPTPLRPTADHTAYRIVQESLTNVARHAGADTATVTLTYDPVGVRITVVDTGAPTARARGHGIDGMRERAVAFGGTLDAGPRPGGGFQVEAWLPN